MRGRVPKRRARATRGGCGGGRGVASSKWGSVRRGYGDVWEYGGREGITGVLVVVPLHEAIGDVLRFALLRRRVQPVGYAPCVKPTVAGAMGWEFRAEFL